ncbi:MAG: hypothetical protein IJH38_01050, partial [Clostridia bacterium]|nr:hypothetical protein [Clostridia bacterium]
DEADIAHTALETGLEEGVVREAWYGALKNGLWAWLLCEHVPKGGLNAERRILLLFVDPSSQADAAYQIEKIREGMTPTAAEALATASGAPEGFIHWLIQGEGE